MTDISTTELCSNCGTMLGGKYCSDCGAPAGAAKAIDARQGWSGLGGEFLSKSGRNGIFAVALSFLRHPVDTIIRLTEDSAYTSHWTFLSTCLGAQLTLVYVLLPRLFSAMFNLPDISNSSEVITNEVVQYVGMAILTPVQYYLCRALGTVRRTPMSYVKLCALSISYGAMLSIAAVLVFFALSVLIVKTGFSVNIQNLWVGLSALTLLAILVFVTASHRRFWGMRWPIAVAATLVIAVLSWSAVYPGLSSLAEKAGIPGTLGRLLG